MAQREAATVLKLQKEVVVLAKSIQHNHICIIILRLNLMCPRTMTKKILKVKMTHSNQEFRLLLAHLIATMITVASIRMVVIKLAIATLPKMQAITTVCPVILIMEHRVMVCTTMVQEAYLGNRQSPHIHLTAEIPTTTIRELGMGNITLCI
jgi:hypothetical protein